MSRQNASSFFLGASIVALVLVFVNLANGNLSLAGVDAGLAVLWLLLRMETKQ